MVGCGAVSEVLYGKALLQLEGEGLVSTSAVVDPNPRRTAVVGAILPGARQCASLDEALAQAKPDLAIIAAPHRFHADQAVQCLDGSVAVLCEKPMATTVAECDRMIAAAERSGRVLAVGHFRRFFPSCQIIKTMIVTGALGAVRSFRVLEGETYSWPAQSASFFKREESGGGVLIDAGAHTIDLLLWWLGDVSEAHYVDDAMGGVEANSVLRLKMASGAAGTVHLSRDWPLPNRYVIECEHGWVTYICDQVDRLEWGFHARPYGLESGIHAMANNLAEPRQLGADVPSFMACFVNQLRNVVAAAKGQAPLGVSGVEARKTVALIEDCYRRRTLLPMPWLEPGELARAHRLAHV
ncbi:MAG: Gfo/Idh/MocA family oxidoreductase [Vicinamibacterales bacterium]